MGNERDYDGEYQRDRESESEFDDGWSSLASEDKVYEFTKLTPTPPNYYQKQQVTNYSLSLMEQYQGTEKPKFYYSTEQTNSPTQDNKQGNPTRGQRKPGNRQKPQQSKKSGFLGRMFGGGENKKLQKDQKTTADPRNKTEALDPGWGAGFGDDYFETQEQIREGLAESAPDFISLGLDFTPLAGDVKGVVEAIVGKDIITDDKLPGWARALGAVPLFGGILKQAKAGGKLKAFIKLPGVWVEIRSFGNKFDRFLDYLASKLPGWQQRQRFAMAGGGFEAPPDIAQNMTNAISGSGSSAGKSLLEIYRTQVKTEVWGQAGGGVINFLKRTDLSKPFQEEAIQTLLKIQDGIVSSKIDISDSGLAANLKDLVGRLNSRQFNIVEENFAELQRAAQVIEQGDLASPVAIGVKPGHKPKDLPPIDIEKVEADTYFRTADGVLHLNEVKNTPNAFVSKLKETADKGQFKRYRDWIAKGTELKPAQIREVTVYVKNSQPNFHTIIDKRTIKDLRKTIANHNPDATVLQVGSRNFSLDELQQLLQDAEKKLGELIQQEKELNPNINVKELIGSLLNQHFDSMEDTFKILGRTYGY